MTNTKKTKRALLGSVIALILCLSMLVGTTYAWFTDSVVSGKNQIVAGNLDIKLEYLVNGSWVAVDDNTNVFGTSLWEPGHTEVVTLKVSNIGTLALKYQMGINVFNEITSFNAAGEELKLSDHIEFGVVEGQYTDRDAARAAVTNAVKLSDGYSVEELSLLPGQSEELTLAAYMPESVGNEANYKTGEAIPEIWLGINLVATQLMHEDDSFGNDYDEDSEYFVAVGEEVVFSGNKFENTVVNNGDVTLNNVEINVAGNNALYNEGTAELKDATLNMTGSTGYIANSRTDSSVTIYENVTATSSGGGVNVWQGEAIFKSGTITTNSTSTSARHMFYVADGAKLTIEDGEFFFNPTNRTRKGSYICAQANATVIVNGGIFHLPSTRTAPIQAIDGSTVLIYGGTFQFDPSAYVAEGYQAIESNGWWTVSAK